ncbi:MAG TPA: nucleotide disphospho-sugar-binding domain-containing protein [Vicinamibacterales bacterium]|nr:nucleotide disphospho-sugar-binding domain-containing protein [Vicinamibacterales bacterium]
MTNFLLTPVGSSGDVYPFIGIGRTLRARGHEVTMVAAEPFRAACERAELRFVPIHAQAEFDDLTMRPDLWHGHRELRFVLRKLSSLLRAYYDLIASVYEPGRTVLVAHPLAFAARVFEDAHRAPAATIHLAPSIFRPDSQESASIPGIDALGFPRGVTRIAMWLVDRLRRETGLPPVSTVFRTWLHSPQCVIGLFPEWFAPIQPDWPAQVRLTGFPLYDESDAHAITPDLESFLNAGTPPILFTPGTANYAAAQFFAAALDATRRLKRRALFVTRYPEQLPKHLSDQERAEPYVSFSRVFPRCAASVHHGGIGTSAQALAAGIPQLTMPLAFDQPDNAARLCRLGVARTLPPHEFRGDRVATEVAALIDDHRVAERCRHWADQVRDTDGLVATCALLEGLTVGVRRGSDRGQTGV